MSATSRNKKNGHIMYLSIFCEKMAVICFWCDKNVYDTVFLLNHISFVRDRILFNPIHVFSKDNIT